MYLDTHIYSECSGCTACESICKNKAISFSEFHNGFYYPVIDYEKCIDCNMCRKVCVFEHNSNKDNQSIIYYGWNNNGDIRHNSTSGGLFSAIVYSFFNNCDPEQASVFGASWTSVDAVEHIYINEANSLNLIQRSKYIQSDLSDVLQKIKTKLENKEWVLFSGTPCQIAGLKSFLGNTDISKLLTIDFVCNGVSSPVVFKDYIKRINTNNKLIEYSFRNKVIEKNSQKYVKYVFDDGKTKIREDDLFYMAYQLRLLHRESCFYCPYSERHHEADITLGDFWHIEDRIPELVKERIHGISLVKCNTPKGKFYIDSLDDVTLRKTDIIPIAKRLSDDMRDPGVDAFFENYSDELIIKNLFKYIGLKRYLIIKYDKLYKFYAHLKKSIMRGLKND